MLFWRKADCCLHKAVGLSLNTGRATDRMPFGFVVFGLWHLLLLCLRAGDHVGQRQKIP